MESHLCTCNLTIKTVEGCLRCVFGCGQHVGQQHAVLPGPLCSLWRTPAVTSGDRHLIEVCAHNPATSSRKGLWVVSLVRRLAFDVPEMEASRRMAWHGQYIACSAHPVPFVARSLVCARSEEMVLLPSRQMLYAWSGNTSRRLAARSAAMLR